MHVGCTHSNCFVPRFFHLWHQLPEVLFPHSCCWRAISCCWASSGCYLHMWASEDGRNFSQNSKSPPPFWSRIMIHEPNCEVSFSSLLSKGSFQNLHWTSDSSSFVVIFPGIIFKYCTQLRISLSFLVLYHSCCNDYHWYNFSSLQFPSPLDLIFQILVFGHFPDFCSILYFYFLYPMSRLV